MTCEFYWISGSPFSWRVHLALEYKQIGYRSKLINVNEGGLETDEFLKLNPHGRVPVIRDGEAVIYESVAILAYLDARYPQKPLFGSDPTDTGLIWQRVQEIENNVRNPILRLAIAVLNADIKKYPDNNDQLLELCREQLEWVEGALLQSKWISGAILSAADLVFYPILKIFLRAIDKPVASELKLAETAFAERWPNTAKWAEQVEQIKGYSNTYPPHWN